MGLMAAIHVIAYEMNHHTTSFTEAHCSGVRLNFAGYQTSSTTAKRSGVR